jgi:hypothetical protein
MLCRAAFVRHQLAGFSACLVGLGDILRQIASIAHFQIFARPALISARMRLLKN